MDDQRKIAAVMRDKYFDPDGWKQCTLRHYLCHDQQLWLLCGTCQKSRDFDIPEWSKKYGVSLDTPLKTLQKVIRCQRCGTRNVSAYGTPYSNLPKEPAQRSKDGPICPRCGSDDVHTRRMRTTDFPQVVFPNIGLPRFVQRKVMQVCGCDRCDNWWTQPEGLKLEYVQGRK